LTPLCIFIHTSSGVPSGDAQDARASPLPPLCIPPSGHVHPPPPPQPERLVMRQAVLRIRDVYPGSRIRLFSVPDPDCLHPGSQILIKEFKYFNPKKIKKTKKWFLSSKKYDLGCSSRILAPDADFLPIPDPGSRGQKGTQSQIPDPDPQHLRKMRQWALGNKKKMQVCLLAT
jgi:hypothetical protein